MNPLQDLQRQAQIAQGIEALFGFVILILFVWAAIWSVKAFNRWERRDEAKLKALQQIAARLSGAPETPSNARASGLPDFRATR